MRRIHQIVGVTGFRGLWAWQIGQSIGIDENITYVGVANFFLGQSIGSGRGKLFLGQSIGIRGKLFFRSIDRY